MQRRALIYVRLSKDREGADLAIERQRTECADLAARLDWVVVEVHHDDDISAYSGKPRPGYRALLDGLRAGYADAVIAWHTDRLHRSPRELEEYLDVCEAHGVQTQTVKAGHLDLSTASGRMVARNLGSVARYEVEHMIERVRAQKRQAALNGRWRGGQRPYGYEADGITVRESEGSEVRAASTAILGGLSLHAIARDWNERGVCTSGGGRWRSQEVRRVLLRARNAGLIEHCGKEIGKAEWDPIVNPDVWRAVRGLLLDPSRRTAPMGGNRRWLGSGIYRCGECSQGLISGRTQQGRPVYRCAGRKHVSRDAGYLDGLVGDLVVSRLSQPDAVALLDQDPVDTAPLHAAAELQRLRLDELARAFADGVIDARQLQEGSESGRARLAEIERELASAVRTTELDGLAGAPDVAEVWQQLDLSRRRAVVSALVVVTVQPGAGRGRQADGGYFDPESIGVTWR